jgi:hypothetical protein
MTGEKCCCDECAKSGNCPYEGLLRRMNRKECNFQEKR